uniref:Laminin EGF-like domain-containing protein n=1 Tax=Macrostomum lignano TaxID=282301 RepID=A0A1I8HHF0_9PLAT
MRLITLIIIAVFQAGLSSKTFEINVDRPPEKPGSDNLLPLAHPSELSDASSCPNFVHGSLRHSLMSSPTSAAGLTSNDIRVRLNSLMSPPSSTSSRGFWTGSLVTLSGSGAAAALRVVAPDGVCGASAASASATVSETAARHGCSVALNAGLFDPSTSRCLGNLFVEQSIKAECSETQTTGSLRRFATVVSARSAVGQLRNGDLVLIKIVGKTDVSGINLFDLADLLIDLGVYNAVNLDGGGSSTLVVNGTVVGSPPDSADSPHRSCERPVTSILCVNASRGSICNGEICSPIGGQCLQGECRCRPGYTGWGCHSRCRCLNSPPGYQPSCHPVSGDCDCPPGYRGRLCESRCPPGFYGAGCARVCVCPDGGEPAVCHHVNGTCLGSGGGEGFTANGAYNLLLIVRRRLSTINWAVVVLPSVLAASCLLNACLVAKLCRLRRSAGRLRSRWRLQRHEMRRLVAADGSDSDGSGKELTSGL